MFLAWIFTFLTGLAHMRTRLGILLQKNTYLCVWRVRGRRSWGSSSTHYLVLIPLKEKNWGATQVPDQMQYLKFSIWLSSSATGNGCFCCLMGLTYEAVVFCYEILPFTPLRVIAQRTPNWRMISVYLTRAYFFCLQT